MTLLTVDDIAARLKISRRQAARVAKSCLHVRVGRLVRVPEQALERYLRAQTEEPKAWDGSTSAGLSITRTGRMRKASRIDNRFAPETGLSHSPGCELPNWDKPIVPRTMRTPSTKR